MPALGQIVERVRSKNAGPFWVSVDVFCGSPDVFSRVRDAVSTDRIAALYGQPVAAVQAYFLTDLNVIKLSFPRPTVQGARDDRDMHGAQWAVLLAEMEINQPA
ncbi:MAG: DUF4387 family protein [Pseudomonadota bacterium]